MSLREMLQTKLIEARKAKNQLQLGLLQTILGDASTLESRGKALTDEDMEAVIRKIANANYTALALIVVGKEGEKDKDLVAATAKKIVDGDMDLIRQVREKSLTEYNRVASEDGFLMSLVPKTLTVSQIKDQLAETVDAIKGAKNEGAATGIAVKALKAKAAKALGEDVAKAVKELRS